MCYLVVAISDDEQLNHLPSSYMCASTCEGRFICLYINFTSSYNPCSTHIARYFKDRESVNIEPVYSVDIASSHKFY